MNKDLIDIVLRNKESRHSFSRLIIGFKNLSDKKPKDEDMLSKFKASLNAGLQRDW